MVSSAVLCLLTGHLVLAKKRVFYERERARFEERGDPELAELHTKIHDESLGRSHAVLELPGLPFGYDHPMYAGQVSAYEPTLQNKGSIFYWLVESQHRPMKDPLVIWLNGGPGCSSLEGFLIEHGPLLAVATGFDLDLNPYSWNQRANILYVDQPVGTGYSTARDGRYAQSQEEVNVMFMAFLRRFMSMHPRYKGRALFLSGESYAGRYIPHFTHQILAGGEDFNLQGVMIGNGWTHPIVQSESFPEFSFSVGLVSQQQKRQYDGLLRDCQERYKEDPYAHDTWVVCERLQSFVPDVSGNSKTGKINIYDVRLYDTTAGGDWPWRKTGEKQYLSRADVQQALHAHSVGQWSECSDQVEEALTHEDMYPTIEEFRTMIPHVRVLVYTGQFDWICNHVGVERFLDQTDFVGKEDFVNSTRRAQWISGSRVAGYVKRGGNLTFVLALGASHMMPVDKRPQAYDMLDRFVNNRSFEDIKSNTAEQRAEPFHETLMPVGSLSTRAVALLEQGSRSDIVDSALWRSTRSVAFFSALVGFALYPVACAVLQFSRQRRVAALRADTYSPMLA